MAKFDLELRAKIFGSILTWKVFLEDSTNDGNKVTDWEQHPDGYRVKILPGYEIKDKSLEVFAGCQGIEGGSITCEVVINKKMRPEKVKAYPTDRIYAKKSYQIKPAV